MVENGYPWQSLVKERDNRGLMGSGHVIEVSFVDVDAVALPVVTQLVTAADRADADRLPRHIDGIRLLARRALVRVAVAHWLGLEPLEVRIRRRCPFCLEVGHGIPVVEQPPRPEVSIGASSSRTRAVVAVCEGRSVGIDLEALLAPFPLSPDDAGVFVSAERTALRNARARQFDRLGYRIWVRKEAIAKSMRLGLVAPLAGIDCTRRGDRWVSVVDQPDPIWYRDLVDDDLYAGAIAVSGAPGEIVTVDWCAAILGGSVKTSHFSVEGFSDALEGINNGRGSPHYAESRPRTNTLGRRSVPQ
jgi:phosphopantetheinyl transferase